MIKLEPTANHYSERAKFYDGINKSKKAIKDYSKAIKLSPQSAWLFHNRAHAYEKLSLYQNAIDDFSNAIAIEPAEARHIQCRGVSFFREKSNVEAESDFNKAIIINPNNDANYYYRALIRERQGHYRQSIEESG